MKKIIAAFDGLRFSENTLHEAVRLAKQHHAHLVGVFLQEFTSRGFIVYESLVSQSASGKSLFEELENQDELMYEASIDTFEAACKHAGVNYSLHRDRHSALKDLLHESVFADLMLIDPTETFSYIEENTPGWFMKSLLHEAHCPVWLVPQRFSPVSHLVFLYDGSPSSVFAMKMFTYLFPEMTSKECMVLSVRSGTLNLHLPDHKLIHEWMKRHYPHAEYKVVKGETADLIAACKTMLPGMLIVAGAYERNKLSTWLHPSLADELLQELKVPLFLAHSR